MKKLYHLLFVLFIASAVQAQDGQSNKIKKHQEIEALKVAFISKELELTPDEAQKFWPVFNEYAKEKKAINKENKEDVLERDEKVLNLRKRYKDQFVKIIGEERVKRLFNAESRFKEVLIKAIKERKQKLKENRQAPQE